MGQIYICSELSSCGICEPTAVCIWFERSRVAFGDAQWFIRLSTFFWWLTSHCPHGHFIFIFWSIRRFTLVWDFMSGHLPITRPFTSWLFWGPLSICSFLWVWKLRLFIFITLMGRNLFIRIGMGALEDWNSETQMGQGASFLIKGIRHQLWGFKDAMTLLASPS